MPSAKNKTTIGRRDRFFHFPVEEDFRAFVSRCNLEHMDKFNRSLAQWGRGSNYCHLTEEQYQSCADLALIWPSRVPSRDAMHPTLSGEARWPNSSVCPTPG
jgi:hypothetical protein